MSYFHPELGVGVGLRQDFFNLFEESTPSPVTWVEVITENFIDWKDQEILAPVSRLKKVRQQCPVVFHGVSLSLGSGGSNDRDFLKRLQKLMNEIEPLWVSDHLCWTKTRTHNLHDLYPLPYNEESLAQVVAELHRVQDFLKQPFVVENASAYVSFAQSTMTEWEFISEMVRMSGARLLLDINNVYVNSFNFGFDPKLYLSSIPHEAVCQIHLAGHENRGTYLFDTHDDSVCDEVWNLYEWYIETFGYVPTMIERDGNIPEWAVLAAELQEIETMRLAVIDKEGKANAHSRTASAIIR